MSSGSPERSDGSFFPWRNVPSSPRHGSGRVVQTPFSLFPFFLRNRAANTSFDTTEGVLVSRLWDASNEFEWEKALDDELLLDRKYPYLLCSTSRRASGRMMSGYQRAERLREEIESHFGEEHGEDDRRYYLRTLYNEKDYYCAYGQLPATGEFRRPVRGFWGHHTKPASKLRSFVLPQRSPFVPI